MLRFACNSVKWPWAVLLGSCTVATSFAAVFAALLLYWRIGLVKAVRVGLHNSRPF